MTKEELINNGKFLIFPNQNDAVKSEYVEFLGDNREDVIYLPIKPDMKYIGMKYNSHHYTTEYHRKYVIPSLCKLLNIDTNYMTQFNVIEKQYVESGSCYNLSYLSPRNMEQTFICENYEHSIKYIDNFTGLMYVDGRNNNLCYSEYHKLFCFPHSCSRIINEKPICNKKIFISGDSQIIPSLPFLCTYFSEVWYFDNRSNIEFKDKYENEFFDYVLFEMHNGDFIDYYMNKNLK